jgi:hypothetical protein
MGETLWNAARLQLLRDLHAVGFSCARIAQKLGGGIDRGQVIKKALALKLGVKESIVERDRDPKFRSPKPSHVNRITLAERA